MATHQPPTLMNQKILIWNIRGIGNAQSIRRLKILKRRYQLAIIAIIEPKKKTSCIDMYRSKLHMAHSVANLNDQARIWIFWEEEINILNIDHSDQHITVSVSSDLCRTFYFTIVHASCSMIERRKLWDYMIDFSTGCTDPWLIGGDFNTYLAPEEKKGGKKGYSRSVLDFQACISAAGIQDAGFKGSRFTWFNGQLNNGIWTRIDRLFFNSHWAISCPAVQVQHLDRFCSDHSPLLLSFVTTVKKGPSRFIFQQMWCSHERFMQDSKAAWCSAPTSSYPILSLIQKLKHMKAFYKQWNKETFGNVTIKVQEAESTFKQAQERYEEDDTQVNYNSFISAKDQLEQVLAQEEKFWRQKSRIKWLKDGDHNTKFFHAYAITQRRNSSITKLHNKDGAVVEEDGKIADLFVEHFTEAFRSAPHQLNPDVLNHIPSLLTTEDNAMICSVPTSDEIKAVVHSMDPDSAPGPDGFSGYFFQICWELIHTDVTSAVQAYFCGHSLPTALTSSVITLIPKTENPKTCSDFRPISLSNFLYKIISRIITDRLGTLLPSLISEEQGAFTKGRNIAENILLAKELLQHIDRPCRGGNMIIKLDMAKAYDRLEWDYLFAALRRFGFSLPALSLIDPLISNCWFSILINGRNHGFFKSSRGIRQGDPVAPALFILAEEALSRGLKTLFHHSSGSWYQTNARCPAVSHLLFADDTLIFSNASVRHLRRLMDFLRKYEETSGQLINKNKSSFYVPTHATESLVQKIIDTTGFTRTKLPIKYLGVSIYAGRQKPAHFASILAKTVNKLQGWKTDLLSTGGRLILIQHVLTALPIYTMNAMPLPVTIVRAFHRLLANFFWGSYEGSPKRHWKSWNTIAQPKECGGLGVLNLNHMQIAFRTKMLWRALSTNSLWARFFRGKHLFNCHYTDANLPFMLAADRKLWMQAAQVIHNNHRIIMMDRNSNSHFWFDVWTGTSPLKKFIPEEIWTMMPDKYCTIQQVFGDPMGSHLQMALKYCPINLLSSFLTTSSTHDIWIWCPSSNGQFSTKSVCSLLNSESTQQWKAIWSPYIPLKWSILLWRLVLNTIPVDRCVKDQGVPLASKCSCCPQHHEESALHLFFKSCTANQVWTDLSHLLHFRNLEVTTVAEGINSFLARPEIVSPAGRLMRCTFMAIIWEIWCSRNRARFQNLNMSAKHIVNRSLLAIRAICVSFNFQKIPQPWLNVLRQDSTALSSPEIRSPTVVRWIHPPKGRLKLNVDGAFKPTSGQAGGGGIIRDHEGNCVTAFAQAYHGLYSSIAAEALALRDGISICRSKGISEFHIETDSYNLYQIVTEQSPCPWDLVCIIQDIAAKCQNLKAEIMYVPREANRVADSLASFALTCTHFVTWHSRADLPHVAEVPYHLDMVGQPSMRP